MVNIYREEWNTLLRTLDRFVSNYKYLNDGKEPDIIMSDINNILADIIKADKNCEEMVEVEENVLLGLNEAGVFESIEEYSI